jgi:hypothetical protein|tara:strand:+ start:113 stop:394 length:282 start_codon:yes stop_codon:yes gene_type:complete
MEKTNNWNEKYVKDMSFSYLMKLWFAVHQGETDKYNSIHKNLDKYGVPFSIQNKVFSNAFKTSKKAIDTLEVKDRIKKIVDNFVDISEIINVK